jgi:tetratricopeptide (TPR) repeat protein
MGAAVTSRPPERPTAEGVELDPLLPYYLALSGALSKRGRHAEAAALLRQAQTEADEAQEQVGALLIDELIADSSYEKTLDAALDLLEVAPLAASRALFYLRDNARPGQLPNVVPRLMSQDWVRFARRTEIPAEARVDIVSAVAELLQKQGRQQESVDVLEAVPQGLGDSVRLLLLIGRARAALRQRQAAEEALTAAASAISPSTPPELAAEVRLSLAELYESFGRVTDALSLLDPEADATSPTSRGHCLALRAVCLAQTGLIDEARASTTAADALAPDLLAVVSLGTWVLLGARDLDAALQRASRGLRRFPESDELSVLRIQVELAIGSDIPSQSRRLARLIGRVDRVDLEILVARTLRVRSSEDASLQYFLAVVHEAADQYHEAMASVNQALELLTGTARPAGPAGLEMAARRLRAGLLEDSDPTSAAKEYATAGNDAFVQGEWELALELLSAAERLGGLDQRSRWSLAESYLLCSYVSSEPMGVSESRLKLAITTWEIAFREGLPDVESAWTYISRGRMELQSARLDRRVREHAFKALLYCECTYVVTRPTTPWVSLYADATRMLGLYGLGCEMQQQALSEAGAVDVNSLTDLLVGAANAGDLELFRKYLPRLTEVTKDSSSHEYSARLHLLEGDPRAAVDELASVVDEDRNPLYFEWFQLLAYAGCGDDHGVESVLAQARQHLSAGPERAAKDRVLPGPGIRLVFWLLLGDPEAAAALLDDISDEESWFSNAEFDAALTRLMRGDVSSNEAEMHRFVATTRSFEDVVHIRIELDLLRSRYARERRAEVYAAFDRVRRYAEERLARGGWPLTAASDAAELLRDSESLEVGPLALAVERAVSARRALGQQDWLGAAERYRSLLRSEVCFPEAEQGLILLVSSVLARFLKDETPDALTGLVSQLSEALSDIDPDRPRRPAPNVLEVCLGDAHVHLGSIADARALYETALTTGGEREGRAATLARLHITAVLLGETSARRELDMVLEACKSSAELASRVVLDASAALLRSPVQWRQLVEFWERELGDIRARLGLEAADQVDLLIADAMAELAWALYRQGDLERTEAELRGAFERRIRLVGTEDPGVLARRSDLSFVLTQQGRFAEAEAEYRAVAEGRARVLGQDDPATLSARYELAYVLQEQGRLAGAEAEYRAVAEGRARVLGEDDPATWLPRYQLAYVLLQAGRLEEAEQHYRQVLEAEIRLQGAEDPSTLITRHDLAVVLGRQGRFTEAEAESRAVFQARLRVLGQDDPATLSSRYELAWTLYKLEDYTGAEAEYRAVAEGRARVLGEDDPATLSARYELALVLQEQGRLAEADAESRAVEQGRARAGPEGGNPTEAR